MRAAKARTTERDALEAEVSRLRRTLEAIRDVSAIEATCSMDPVSTSALNYISVRAAQALEAK